LNNFNKINQKPLAIVMTSKVFMIIKVRNTTYASKSFWKQSKMSFSKFFLFNQHVYPEKIYETQVKRKSSNH